MWWWCAQHRMDYLASKCNWCARTNGYSWRSIIWCSFISSAELGIVKSLLFLSDKVLHIPLYSETSTVLSRASDSITTAHVEHRFASRCMRAILTELSINEPRTYGSTTEEGPRIGPSEKSLEGGSSRRSSKVDSRPNEICHIQCNSCICNEYSHFIIIHLSTKKRSSLLQSILEVRNDD